MQYRFIWVNSNIKVWRTETLPPFSPAILPKNRSVTPAQELIVLAQKNPQAQFMHFKLPFVLGVQSITHSLLLLPQLLLQHRLRQSGWHKLTQWALNDDLDLDLSGPAFWPLTGPIEKWQFNHVLSVSHPLWAWMARISIPVLIFTTAEFTCDRMLYYCNHLLPQFSGADYSVIVQYLAFVDPIKVTGVSTFIQSAGTFQILWMGSGYHHIQNPLNFIPKVRK